VNTPSDEQSPVDLLAEDFLDRRQRGETPTIEEYCRRHPELEDEIREVFEALLMVEDLKPGSEDEGGTLAPDVQLDGRRLERVGDYRILCEIGRGGMGVVYEAEQESLGRRVALKILPRQLSDDATTLARFQREARAAARMHHTNIVPVFDVGQDGQHLFYAMQLIQGQGLDQVIDELERLRSEFKSAPGDAPSRPEETEDRDAAKAIAVSLLSGHFRPENLAADSAPPNSGEANRAESIEATITLAMQGASTSSAVLPGQSDISTAESNHRAYFLSVAQIGLQTAGALSYAHARGIIHRDVKPSNLILDAAGIVWVTDFGLAKTSDQPMTQTGDILGTIRYMSPERFRGQCDVRADIYALGLTLYELLVLKPAFQSSDRLKLIDLASKTEPTAPRTIDSRIPRDLETVVLKAIDKDPKRRYQSADEMADDLQRVVNDEPILARRISVVERAVRWSRRNPWLAAASSVAAVGLVAVAVLSTLFAQEQSRLNQEKTRLNVDLTEANAEQKRLNAELAETAKERGEMIARLRTGQSRLAGKQAEYDLQRGSFGEGMLWLARCYELAPPDETALGEELLSQLSVTAEQIPRLRTSATLDTRPRNDAIVGQGSFSRHLFVTAPGSGFSRDRRLLVTQVLTQQPTEEGQQPKRQIRLWDVADRKFVGRAVEVSGGGQFGMALSPDNRYLASVRLVVARPPNATTSISVLREPELTVSNLDTGEPVFGPIPVEFDAASRPIDNLDVCFSQDGSEVLLAARVLRRTSSRGRSYGFDVLRWAADSGSSLEGAKIEPDWKMGFVHTARFSPDGTRLLVGRGPNIGHTNAPGLVGLYDIETADLVGEVVEFDGAVGECLPLSADGRRFAVLLSGRFGRDQRVEVWDSDEGKRIGSAIEMDDRATRLHSIRLMGADRSGSRLVIAAHGIDSGRPREVENGRLPRGTGRGQVRVWDVATGKPLTAPLFTTGPALAATLAADGATIIVRDMGGVRTWELPGPRLQRVLLPNEGPLRHLSPGIRTASFGSSSFRSSPFFSDSQGDIGYGERNDLYMANSREDRVAVTRWDVATGRLLDASTVSLAADDVVACFGPGARALVTYQVVQRDSHIGTTIRCWQTGTGEPIGQPIHRDQAVLPLAVSHGGEMIAGMELVSDSENGKVGSAENESGPGRQTASARSLPQRLRVWETATGKAIDAPSPIGVPLAAGFAQFLDRATLAFGTPEAIRLWNLKGGVVRRLPSEVPVEMGKHPMLESECVLGPDGRLVADSPDGFALRIWDLTTGRPVGSPIEHGQHISAITFDADGRTVATASADGIVRQWSLPGDWSGEPAETTAKVEAMVGMRLEEEGRFEVLDPESQSRRLREMGIWQEDGPNGNMLSHPEREALLDFGQDKWVDAATKLDRWIDDRPQEWAPRVLRVGTLAEEERYDEARQCLEQAVGLSDARTVTHWLMHYFYTTIGGRESRDARERLGKTASESKQRIQEWYFDQVVEISPSHEVRGEWLVRRANSRARQGRPNEAIADLSRAIDLRPDDAALRKKRARFYEQALQWDLVAEDYQVAVLADPEEHFDRYHLGTILLYTGDIGAYRELCQKMLEHWGNSEEPTIQERTGKLCLLLPVEGDDLERAFAMTDAAYDAATTGGFRNYYVLARALADYRRDRYDEALKNVTEANAAFDDRGGRSVIYSALGDLVAAMAWHKKGDRGLARRKYADAWDRIDFVYESYIEPGRLIPYDWMMAEIVRREAETLLDTSAETLGLPLPDTQDWKVVLSDDFDRDEVGDTWTVEKGQWAPEDGALRGTVEDPGTMPNATIHVLDVKTPEYLEVEYDTWWPEGAISAIILPDLDTRRAYVAALCGTPNPILVGRGEKGTGAHMLSSLPGGSGAQRWIAKDPEFELNSGQRYHIRLLRQPNRLTLFVDGKEIFSEPVPTIDAPTLRFYGSGPVGAVLYFDNLVVRAPEGDTSNDR